MHAYIHRLLEFIIDWNSYAVAEGDACLQILTSGNMGGLIPFVFTEFVSNMTFYAIASIGLSLIY